MSDYRAKKQRFARENEAGTKRKGMGMAAFLHGAGFTGSGERYLSSVVGVEGRADGRVRVLVSSTEFGQGTKTVLCQIAAETLGLPYEQVGIAQADTDEVPNSGPTVASRTVMVVGKLVQSAALGIRQTLAAGGMLGESVFGRGFRAACKKQVAAHGSFLSWARFEAPSDVFWDDEKYRGEAYAAYAWAVYIAEVTVDLTSYSRWWTTLWRYKKLARCCIRFWPEGKSPVASRKESDIRFTRKSFGKTGACKTDR